jgi:DNA-binding transcriptional MerR regulator
MDKPDLLQPWEASNMTELRTKRLAELADRGRIRAVKTPLGHRRYYREDIEQLAIRLLRERYAKKVRL